MLTCTKGFEEQFGDFQTSLGFSRQLELINHKLGPSLKSRVIIKVLDSITRSFHRSHSTRGWLNNDDDGKI